MEIRKFDIPEGSAFAQIKGGFKYPDINGVVFFAPTTGGVMVTALIKGLPAYKSGADGSQPVGPHGFHIHEGDSCDEGGHDNPFEHSLGHYNPTKANHGNHAGDFPVLFSNNGVAEVTFYTNRFSVPDILGKVVIIHENPDDYRTQPSGNPGIRIACGKIEPVKQ